ncbi:hypothetical protein JZ751_016281, partial [Albula glossodonta]
MWQVVQQQHMVHYGKLEEFVSLVMETVPELLSDRQRTQLTVGLRERMASPVEFESKTDTALQVVLWELLSRLEQLLPVPDLKQTVSWLSAAPSVLEECVQSVCKPQQLKTLLQHHRDLGHLDRNDPFLLLSSLHLLVPPLQLISAAMWQVVQQQDMVHYGKLEEFVSLVMETVPELLSDRQRTQLTVGLRERVREEREEGEGMDTFFILFVFFCWQVNRDTGVFPVEFESKTDTALQVVLWELLSRLEQLLPVPDLRQTVSWLRAAPSVLEECVQSVCKPQQLKTLLQHHRDLGHLDRNASPSSNDECKLSPVPCRGALDSTKLRNSNSHSEPLPSSVNILPSTSAGGNSQSESEPESSPAFPCEHMKAEPVINNIDYTGVCLKSSPDRSGNIEESKNGYGMSREEKDILSNIKEEDEGEERQSVMMEMEDGVRDEERLWREQEKERDDQRDNVTDQITQTDTAPKNEAKTEWDQ